MELFQWKTVVLSIHVNTWLTVTVRSCVIALFNRAAVRAACNSSVGTLITFIGATCALTKTKASSVFSLPVGVVPQARKNATALKMSWELSANIWYSNYQRVRKRNLEVFCCFRASARPPSKPKVFWLCHVGSCYSIVVLWHASSLLRAVAHRQKTKQQDHGVIEFWDNT